MNERTTDRYGVQFEAWIFDYGLDRKEAKVVARIQCTTNGRASVRIEDIPEFRPHMLDLIAKVSLALRGAAAETIDFHAAVETEARHLKMGGSVYDVPEIA